MGEFVRLKRLTTWPTFVLVTFTGFNMAGGGK